MFELRFLGLSGKADCRFALRDAAKSGRLLRANRSLLRFESTDRLRGGAALLLTLHVDHHDRIGWLKPTAWQKPAAVRLRGAAR
jgi:hypothetical protein